jgi:hypothetical protein
MLSEIDAVSQSDIWAVGVYTNDPMQTLIMHWDGSQWTRVASPGTSSSSQLNGVAAISAVEVWAVGSENVPLGTSLEFRTLMLHWDGTQWTRVPSPSPSSPAFSSRLFSVTDLPDGDVWAAGMSTQGTLIVRRQGNGWVTVPSPTPGYGTNVLLGADALTAGDIWTVGYFTARPAAGGIGSYRRPLIERWDGSQWEVIPSIGPYHTTLYDVSAVSANDVWAVGLNGAGPEYQTLVEHWDGTQWTIVPSPNPVTEFSYLYGVDAVAANDVWAVGSMGDPTSSSSSTLIEHWDGTQWQVVPSPDALNHNSLADVFAISANDVWAVGFTNEVGSAWHPLALHWNGSQWVRVITPDFSGGYLAAVGGTSSSDVWAVGYYGAYPNQRTLVLHWDGVQWMTIPSPNVGSTSNFLRGVSATSPTDAWAVGSYGTYPNEWSLLLHWDGTAWAIVPSANPEATRNVLNDVVALSPRDVWAMGYQFGVRPEQTLIEHVGRFSDVVPTDYFNVAVEYLVSHGAISGYSNCTFRPWNYATRSQLTKIVVLAEGWPIDTTGGPHFSDVPVDHPFYAFVETAYNRGVIDGYSDRTFRPFNNITRGQLCKVITLAEGWANYTPPTPSFSDVPVDHPFYVFIETAASRGVVSGYADGTFRPYNDGTRGQISKIVYLAVTAP